MRQYFNWKTYLAVIALFIVGASLYYTSHLASKLADEERKKVEQVANAIKTLISTNNTQEQLFASNIIGQNESIPLIITDASGNVISSKNIDSVAYRDFEHVVQDK